MSPNFNELLTGVKQEIEEVTPQEIYAKLNGTKDFTLLDVREKDEWDQGHIEGAEFLPRGFLEVKVEKMLTDKDQPIVVYCAGGVRSAFAAPSASRTGPIWINTWVVAGEVRSRPSRKPM